MCQSILAICLVIIYTLLEDRRIDDVIITNIFKNLENISHDWEKENAGKVLSRLWSDTREEGRKKNTFVCEKWLGKLLERRLIETENMSWIYLKIRNHCFSSISTDKPKKQNVYETDLFKKFSFSESQNNC